LKGYKALLKCENDKGEITYTSRFKDGFVYEIGKEYAGLNPDNLEICSYGYHFCKELNKVTESYPINHNLTVIAEVTALGEIKTSMEKYCTDRIIIDRLMTDEEIQGQLLEEGYDHYLYDPDNNNAECQGIKNCNDCTGLYIGCSSNVVMNSYNVRESRYVRDSNTIIKSSEILRSHKVMSSTNIYDSLHISYSNMIDYSNNIKHSTFIKKSKNINYSYDVECSYNCEFCQNILFSMDQKQKQFMIFNIKVDRNKFFDIQKKIGNIYSDNFMEHKYVNGVINYITVNNDSFIGFGAIKDKEYFIKKIKKVTGKLYDKNIMNELFGLI
jgi:hypothetical protein